MTDLEQIVQEASADFGKHGGIIILRGDQTTNIGIHGLANGEVVRALEDVLEYVRGRMYGKPSGHTIIRRPE